MIDVLRKMTPAQVRRSVAGFSIDYVHDWDRWTSAATIDRPAAFVRTLGRWQAVRPRRLRRIRARSQEHPPPHIEDLLESAEPYLEAISGLFMGRTEAMTEKERGALETLWSVFLGLPQSGESSCVAITKAVLLLTDGRIGPALDSKVRGRLACGRIRTAREWTDVLVEVTADIRAFERASSVTLAEAVPPRFAALANGRLYDMVLGPRLPSG